MPETSSEAVTKAVAFANGLRKNIAVSGRQWAKWPRGPSDLAKILASIESVQQRLQGSANAEEGAAIGAACVSDLRAILEWTTYQSASIATAQAVLNARKTRAFAERFGLLEDQDTSLSRLLDSEDSLIENVRTKNDYMQTLAERHPHLGLPQPLVSAESLTRTIEKKPGKLALIQRIMQSMKRDPRGR